MVELSQTRDRLRVVNDQFCSPTFVNPLAEAIIFLLNENLTGTYHVVDQAAVTWFEFAQAILHFKNIKTPIDPIGSSDFHAAARRPAYSVLDTTKYHQLGGPIMPTWQASLAEYLTAGP
jgi:dTDP-4-dehydrorhamnose reductase